MIRQFEEKATYLLPPEAYTGQSWFDREQARVFGPRWALVAAVDEVAEPGDFATRTVGRAPLMVLRGADGQLRAFHNQCRHRGMAMLQGCGNVGSSVTCFYHQWRYGLEGDLAVVPQRKEQFPDLDPTLWGLLPAAVEEWEGMAFAHPDPAAPPLAETFGELPDHLGSYRPGRLRQVAHERVELKANWKLFVENHVDVYHLWYLHEESLGDFDHRRFEHRQLGRHWTSYEPVRPGRRDENHLAAGTVAIAHIDERDRQGIGAHMAFPSLLMASSAAFFATYEVIPMAPDRSVVDLRIRGEAGAEPEALLAVLRSFIDEDVDACEAVQVAAGSPAFSVGPLARDHELPITQFHRHLLDALEDGS